jgi:hypothetical protein
MARPKWKRAGRAAPGGKRHRERPPEATKLLERLSARIKRLRLAQEITAAELAAALSIETPAEFVRESGTVSIPAEDLAIYAKVLKVKPADLVK